MKKWPFGLSLVWYWPQIHPKCWFQARPRCWLLGYIFYFFRYFSFVLVVLRHIWYQSKHRFVEASPQERTRKYHQKKKNSLLCFSSHQTTIPTQKPTTIKETRSRKPITHSTRTVPQEFVNTDLTQSFQSHCPQPSQAAGRANHHNHNTIGSLSLARHCFYCNAKPASIQSHEVTHWPV